MTKQTILIVRNADKKDFGGGERYPVYLAEELLRNSFDAIVCSRHNKIKKLCIEKQVPFRLMPWLPAQNFSGYRNVFLPLYFAWQGYLMLWYIVEILKTRSSIVHLQSKDDFIAGTLAARFLHRKVIWTDHADLKYILLNSDRKFKNPIGKLIKHLTKLTHRVVIVSRSELSLIEKSMNEKAPNNFTVIYNGITDRNIDRTRKYEASTTLFVATSRLVKTKGIYELVEATKLLKKDGYDIKTLLLGEGPEEKDIKKISGDSVIFLGFPDNYLSLVKGADVFVHPTYNEGFSLSLLEAAMVGMPTITTRVGGNPEIIKNGVSGILVDPLDINSLYEAMKYAIEHKDTMKKMGIKLRSIYLDKFQFDNIVKSEIIPMYTGKV